MKIKKYNNPSIQKQCRAIYYKDLGGASTLKTDENSGQNIMTGYLNAFGNRDSHSDIVYKGAFLKSIAERGPSSNTHRKIAFLYSHDMKMPIGQFTLLEEREYGLYYEAKPDLVPYVQSTIIPQVKSGTLNNHSIGYNYVWDKGEYDEDNETYHWKELELFEGSLLVAGSNENTPFTGFKKLLKTDDRINDMAIRANKLLKNFNYENEIELRNIICKYQSLLSHAADEITAMRKGPKKPDMKYIVDNFKL